VAIVETGRSSAEEETRQLPAEKAAIRGVTRGSVLAREARRTRPASALHLSALRSLVRQWSRIRVRRFSRRAGKVGSPVAANSKRSCEIRNSNRGSEVAGHLRHEYAGGA
jgi:hypothetical protein